MHEYIRKHKKPWHIVDVVHDAILLEVPLDVKNMQECARVLKRIMTVDVFDVIRRDFGCDVFVPFEVDFKVGISMGSLSKDLTEENLPGEIKKFRAIHDQEMVSGWI